MGHLVSDGGYPFLVFPPVTRVEHLVNQDFQFPFIRESIVNPDLLVWCFRRITVSIAIAETCKCKSPEFVAELDPQSLSS